MTKCIHSILIVIIFSVTLPAKAQQIKLDFMGTDFEAAFEHAKKEKKPVMLLIHSNTCSSSRTFVRKVINAPSVKKAITAGFIPVNANIATAAGRKLARHYGTLILPLVMFISNDKDIEYKCNLSLDTNLVLPEIASFLKCLNIREQVMLYQSTSKVSRKEAQEAIAGYYSKLNFRKNPDANISKEIKEYTLNIPWFSDFEKAYIRKRKEFAYAGK
jgi:hypothetical protein